MILSCLVNFKNFKTPAFKAYTSKNLKNPEMSQKLAP